MAAKSMAELQAALRKKNEQGKSGGSNGGDNASYRFWDMKEKDIATIRFLEDGDQTNDWFWVERQTIKLPFSGVVGGDHPTTKDVFVTVQCADMFEPKTCPITRAISGWWKEDKQRALTYWKKRSFLYQGFVVKSPFIETDTPDNPIRRFVLGPKLHKIIEASLMDPEMPDLPYDRQRGRDFRIIKGRSGEFANYDTSSWSMNSRPLNESELIAIDQYGLWDLKNFRGRQPDAGEIAAIKAMFEASVMGEPFDTESFGKWYRPYEGRDGGTETADEPAPRVAAPPPRMAPPPVAEPEEADEADDQAETVNVAGKLSPAEVMAKIRAKTPSK